MDLTSVYRWQGVYK